MLKSIKLIGSLSMIKIVGSVIALSYSVLQVRIFGANGNMDAYFVAVSIIFTLTSLSQSGQLAEAFVPEYLDLKTNRNAEEAHKLFSLVINRMLVFVTLIILTAYLLSNSLIEIIGFGLTPENKFISVKFFRFSLVLIFFAVVSSFINAVLNAEQIFGKAEWTGVIKGIFSIIFILLFSDTFGIWVLIYSRLFGRIMEMILSIYYLKKIDLKYYYIWTIEGFSLRGLVSVLSASSVYVVATQIFTTVITASVSSLPEGTLSIFNYTKQLTLRASSTLLVPINTVFFAKFAKRSVRLNQDSNNYLIPPISACIILCTILLSFILVVSNDLLSLLWDDKLLTRDELSFASTLLSLNFIGIMFSSTGGIFRKAAVSLGGASRLYFNWTLVQVVFAGYSYWMISSYGRLGLSTIIPLNLMLMSFVSTATAMRRGIGVFRIIKEIIFFSRIGLFVVFSLLFALCLHNISPFNDLNLIQRFGIETIVLLVAQIVLLLVFKENVKGLLRLRLNEFNRP